MFPIPGKYNIIDKILGIRSENVVIADNFTFITMTYILTKTTVISKTTCQHLFISVGSSEERCRITLITSAFAHYG